MELRELKITAELAHLRFNEDELKAAFPAFKEMIDYLDLMQEADIDTAYKAYPGALHAGTEHFRFEDRDAVSVTDSCSNNELLQTAGERDGRFFVIPNVL